MPSQERTALRRVILLQAQAIARVIRGEQPHYLGFTPAGTSGAGRVALLFIQCGHSVKGADGSGPRSLRRKPPCRRLRSPSPPPVDVRHLPLYRDVFGAACSVFDLSKRFPAHERQRLSDQVRKSSRSVGANLAEAWHKRRYPAAFIGKLSDARAESAS